MKVFLRRLETGELRMKRKRFTEEQIIGVLREHEAGGTAQEVCRRRGISEQTFYLYGRLSRCKRC